MSLLQRYSLSPSLSREIKLIFFNINSATHCLVWTWQTASLRVDFCLRVSQVSARIFLLGDSVTWRLGDSVTWRLGDSVTLEFYTFYDVLN